MAAEHSISVKRAGERGEVSGDSKCRRLLEGDLDLGRTSLIKRHIHTGDSRPVNLPPSRIMPVRRIEIQKAVEELDAP